MAGFKVTQKIDDNMKTRLQIEGAMDEHSDYGSIEAEFTDEVVFDFGDVSHINSTGIKHWVQWVEKITADRPHLRFVFINCPKAIVDQMNMVEGFLPSNSKVQSFKVPYYCETCDKDTVCTFVAGREYSVENGQLQLTIPDQKCGRDDCEMEPDVVEQKYFRFLKPR
ncbi:MAG: hypothetical protein KDD33_12130 [Bdellovibrionales bacterium]|nr:hypothetical protein [Bdellovibrionales bacterium]